MTHDPESLEILIKVFAVIAAIFTTSCPLIYMFSPWYSTPLGRVVMLQAVTFASILDMNAVFKFWRPENRIVVIWLSMIEYGLVALATGSLTYMIWQLNHKKKGVIDAVEQPSV